MAFEHNARNTTLVLSHWCGGQLFSTHDQTALNYIIKHHLFSNSFYFILILI